MITYGSTTLTSYNTITNIEVYYYKSTSATSLSGGSWSTTKPTWENGKYIWQKIRTTYEGELENGLYYSESDPVNITGQKGSTGTSAYSYKLNASDTIVTISKTGVYSTNKITFSATSKQGTGSVNAYAGRFKIETTSDGVTWTTRYPASGTGVNESSTEFTIPEGVSNIRCSLYQAGGLSVLLDIVSVSIVNEGKDGTSITITSTSVKYQKGTSGTIKPTGTWGTSIPSLAENEFLWTQTIVNYSDGSKTEAYSVSRNAKNGNDGTSPTVSSTVVEYQQSTGGTTPPTGTWSSTAPTAIAGQYMWTKTTITYSDNKTAISYSVSKNGANGIDGIDGTSQNLLLDVYASSLTKVKAPWDRYLSDATNTTITGEFIAESNLPDPNATHFYRITDSSASTKGRGLCFYNGGTPPFLDGHTYRIGCWVRNHAGKPRIYMYISGIGDWLPFKTIENTDWEWMECVHTFGETDPSITSQSSAYKRMYFYFYNNNVTNSSLDMCGFKIEEVQTDISTARNYLLKTEKLEGWGVTGGATISNGVATFPEVTANTWREIYPTKNFKYELVRNKNIIFSVRVKADTGKKCACDLCIGVDATETAYIRQRYKHNFIYFTGDGEWHTICAAVPISDELFNSGSGTPDYDNCWVTVRIGAVSNYYNSFQAKEPQFSLGTTATAWSAAPEDIEAEISTLRTDLQSQIDEKIQTYYQSTNPATWSVDERTAHDGDLWYYTGTTTTTYTKDNVYRYNASNNTWSVYSASGELFDKVDSKSTIFYGTTSGTYTGVETGDYLVDSTDGSSYRYDGSKWVKVTDYQGAIDAIEVGGRNLLRDTADWKNCPYAGDTASINGENFIAATTTGTNWRRINGWFTKTKEDIYYSPVIISFDVKKSDETPLSEIVFQLFTTNKAYKEQTSGNLPEGTRYYTNLSVNTWKNTENINKDTWTRVYSIPIIMDEYFNTGSSYTEYDYLAFYIGVKAATGSASFRHMKIELGNKATDWTPAPEDMDTSIQQVQENLDNLEIGGRNLLLNTGGNDVAKVRTAIAQQSGSTALTNNMSTKTMSNGEIHFVTTTTTNERYYRFITPVRNNLWGIEPGKTYTISFYTKGTVGASNDIRYRSQYIDTSNWKTISDKTFTEKVGTNYQKVSFTETIPSNATAYYSSIQVYGDDTSNSDFYIKNLKFELGNKPTDWTPAPEDTQADIDTALAQSIEYIVGTQTAATGTWTGNTIDKELKIGKTIAYKLPYDGNGNANLILTLADGSVTNAIPVYLNNVRVTTHFKKDCIINMTYDGTAWRASSIPNSDTYNKTLYSQNVKASTATYTGTHIICGTSEGYCNIAPNVTFDLSYPLLYYATAATTTITTTANNHYLNIPGINFSINGTIENGVAYKQIYLKGTVFNNMFTIASSPFLTTKEPSNNDGYYYIPLGVMSSATVGRFVSSNMLYAYIDGAFQPVDIGAILRAQDAKDRATAVYGTCLTGATTVDKIITCSNFTLFDGARIQITFTNANTAIASEATTASPTLNVNGTGRKPIKIGIEEANTANPLYWAAGATIEFVYDGSAWVLQNAPYTLYGTCNTEENVREKQVVCDGAVICKGTTIYVDMLYSNTADSNSENGNVTLNVANTIAKTIYANNATLTIRSRYNWNAGENPSFTFDGQYWQMDKDTVPAYITDKDEDGIFVHPINDTASGWSIGKVFELLNNGYSYIKMWLEDVTDNLSAKIRIGREDQHHILLDKEIIQFKKGDTSEELASFSSSGISFDDGVPFKIGNDSTYVQFVDNNSDGVADALEIVADKISFKNGGNNTVQDIQERFNDLQTDISNITNNIEINPTADTPYVAITTQKNEYNAGLKLEPTQLSFQLNGQTTATIANDEMNIPTASVTNLFMQSANQSYEKIWVMRSNGHLSLKVGKQN